MQIEIYADVLFFINFFMIFFILYCVNKINKPKVKLYKIVITSSISSFFYCLLVLFVNYSKFINIISTGIIVLFSILYCFKPTSIKSFFKLLLAIYVFSFLIGGLSIYIFYFNSSIFSSINESFDFKLTNFPIKFLVASVILSYILVKYFDSLYKRIFIKKQTFYKIKLYKDNKSIFLNALLDTGNSLKDPLSKKSVLVAEFLAIEDILPSPVKLVFSENKEKDMTEIIKNFNNIDFRLIPFSSIGQENGLMIGIKVDKVEISCDKNIVLNDIIVGICNFRLSKDNIYNAILSPEMLV